MWGCRVSHGAGSADLQRHPSPSPAHVANMLWQLTPSALPLGPDFSLAGSRRAPSTLPTTPSVCPSIRAAALPPCWLLGPLQPRAAHSMQTAALRHPCTQLVTEDTTSPPPPQLLPQTFHEILEAKCQAPLTVIETKNAVGAPQRHSPPQLPSHRLHPFCPSHCKHMHREVITNSNNFPSVFMSPIPSANS